MKPKLTYVIICTKCGHREVFENVTWYNHMPICDNCIAQAIINSKTNTNK